MADSIKTLDAATIAEIKSIYSDIEAKRNFNFRETDHYRVIGIAPEKDGTRKLILEITPEGGNPSFVKEIDPRNILPFGLKGGQPTTNQLNGNEVESYSEVFDTVFSPEGFTVKFITKADGFGSKYDKAKHGELDESVYNLSWGANHYKLRKGAVQMINIIPGA